MTHYAKTEKLSCQNITPRRKDKEENLMYKGYNSQDILTKYNFLYVNMINTQFKQ